MDGADEAFGTWLAAVLITLFACAMLAAIVPSVVTVWAARTRRKRLWLVFVLALVGVASAEICLVTAYMVLKDETSSDWAVILFGALSIASFVGVAKQPTRTALSASSVDACERAGDGERRAG